MYVLSDSEVGQNGRNPRSYLRDALEQEWINKTDEGEFRLAACLQDLPQDRWWVVRLPSLDV